MDSAEYQLILNLINNARTNGIAEIEYKELKVRFRLTPDGSAQTVTMQHKANANPWGTLLPVASKE